MKPILIFLTALLFGTYIYPQNNTVDSLQEVLNNSSEAEAQLPLIADLTRLLSDEDLSAARVYAKRGLALSEQQEDDHWRAHFQYYFGDILQLEGQYDSAHMYFSLAFQYFQSANQAKAAEVLVQRGFVYQNQGRYPEASEQYFSALKIYEARDDQQGVAELYIELSSTLVYLERPVEAEEYVYQAIDVFKTLEDPEGLVNAYKLAAHVHITLNEYEEALNMTDEAIRIKTSLSGAAIEMASLQNTRGNVLKNMGRYVEALTEYQKCLAVARDFNHSRGISATLSNIGDTYLRQGLYTEALSPMLEGVLLQEEYEYTANLPENYDHLSHIYKGLGDYEKALLYREKQAKISADALALEKDAAINELQLEYETAKKEALITSQEQQLQQQRTTQWFVVGVASLLALVLFLLWRSYRQKQANNQILGETNQQLQLKNAENELLLQEIHHRVKNNLQVISSLLNLQSASIDDPNALQAVQESQNRVRSMALIHQKLYQGKNLAAVEMKDYLETVGQTILDTFGVQAEKIKLEVPMTPLEVDVDTAIPLGLIVNELVINSCKYAFPAGQSGKIELSLQDLPEGKRRLTIADDGVGFVAAAEEAPQGTGFGKRLIRLLVLQLNGKIEENHGNGTQYKITF